MSLLSSTPLISISTSINSLAHRLATISMQETFGMDPWPWQSDILATLLAWSYLLSPFYEPRHQLLH
jgi:hypothetical protein